MPPQFLIAHYVVAPVTPRIFISALLALFLLAPVASAQDVSPLAGQGENLQPIARVNLPRPNEIELAGDWAFVSQDEHDGMQGGLSIINIADPTKPFIEGKWNADMAELSGTSFGDVDVTPDASLVALTNAHGSFTEGENPWVVLIDVSDKAHPKMVGQIKDDAEMDYVHTITLDNGGKTLYTNPQVAAFYPQNGHAYVTVFDISNPAKPVKKGTIAAPDSEAGFAHDTYVDHRPDGKTLMYAASIHQTHVIDITDVMAPVTLQTSSSPSYSISHDVQPNHDRTIIVLDDEGGAGGQLAEEVSACGKAGAGPATVDSGSVHFFAAAPDGTLANGGAAHLGSFNAPANAATGACVAHVFWQAPNENRMTQAYYRTGVFVIDFEDPANAKSLGFFLADGGAMYWSNKPHRGYMYATDMLGHVDILKYTGEGGSRWPATAGPAEIQRSARQGVPYVPIAGASTKVVSAPTVTAAREVGKFSFTVKVKKVPGKSGKKAKLTLAFTNASGKVVARLSVKKVAGKKATIKVRGVGVAGSYGWTVKAGKKGVARGKLAVKRTEGTSLSPGATIAASAK